MKVKATYGIIAILLALALCIKNLWVDGDSNASEREEAPVAPEVTPGPKPASPSVIGDREVDVGQDASALKAGAIPNQRILTFKDREAMEQFRPYLLMMRARALAGQAVSDGEAKAALLARQAARSRHQVLAAFLGVALFRSHHPQHNPCRSGRAGQDMT